MSALHVGTTKLAVKNTEYNKGNAIIDTGTPSLSLPANVYTVFVEALKAAVVQVLPDGFWTGTQCAELSGFPADWPTISVTLAQPVAAVHAGARVGVGDGDTAVLTVGPAQYLVDSPSGGSARCLSVSSVTRRGVVIGASVLRGYVTLFDRAQGSVSLAPSRRCGAAVPLPAPTLSPSKPSQDPSAGDNGLKVAGIVLGTVMLIAIGGVVAWWFRRHARQMAEAEAADLETCPRDPLLDSEDANSDGRPRRAKRYSAALL